MRRIVCAFLLLTVWLGAALVPALADVEDSDGTDKAEEGATSEEPKDEGYEEVVVVTASRTETPLHEAPSAVSVVDSKAIETAPADDYGDLLRNIPGINVVQFSALDVQFNTRQAGSNLAQGQQILVDNRSVLFDFNAIMVPSSIPLDFSDVERIEAVRGPGSAVWGAGATNGVVNIITKSPKDTLGTRIRLGAGELGTSYGSVSHSGAAGDVSYRVSGSWYEQDDPYDRPRGTIPGTGTPYPDFPNQGVEQPKIDARVDWDLGDDSQLRFSTGWADFSGIVHTPVGPATWDDGSSAWYAKAEWIRGSLEVRAHATELEADARYFLIPLPNGSLFRSEFSQEAYHLEAVDTRLLGDGRHVLTYGGNVRTSSYDVGIAPNAEDRDEVGLFVQDDIRLGEKWRWLVGARVDDIDIIDTVVSPRTSLMFEPVPGHAFRLSYNRSFRAPTPLMVYVEILNLYELTLPDGMGGTVDLTVPLPGIGNTELDEETLDSIELGWVGNFGDRATLTVSLYRDEIDDVIQFIPVAFYDSSNPPPGWPLPPAVLDVPPPNGFAGLLPSTLQNRNIGEIENQGVEVSAEVRPARGWQVWANASWQDDPEIDGIEQVPLPDGTLVYPVNLPPEWRANAGVKWSRGRYWVDVSGNYQDDAFWTDVLGAQFWGPSDSFHQFHVGAGVRLSGDTIELSVQAQNVTDEDAQQHVWGDIIGRKVTGQVAFRF
jgi:iron complex outermembrane receptor protein